MSTSSGYNGFNLAASGASDEVLDELKKKFGYVPSASQPNEEPMSKRTARGKSLTSTTSEQVRVAGTTPAMSTTMSGKRQRDVTGHRQVTKYRADKTAQQTLAERKVQASDAEHHDLDIPDQEELESRATNFGNRHYQGNPVIVNNRVVR